MYNIADENFFGATTGGRIYEFSGSDTGGSAMAEIGFKYQPKKADNWIFDVMAQGFTGTRDSVALKVGIVYEFDNAATKKKRTQEKTKQAIEAAVLEEEKRRKSRDAMTEELKKVQGTELPVQPAKDDCRILIETE